MFVSRTLSELSEEFSEVRRIVDAPSRATSRIETFNPVLGPAPILIYYSTVGK